MGYQLIETVTVGSGGAASIEFVGIDQTGVDLVLVVSLRSTVAAGPRDCNVRINGSTSGYSGLQLRGTGSAVASTGSVTNRLQFGYAAVPAADQTAKTFSNQKMYFANYTSASAKSVSSDSVGENNATTAYQSLFAHSWSGTDAITSLSVYDVTWAEHSTASLYKITAD
jgi:hypothetical protein